MADTPYSLSNAPSAKYAKKNKDAQKFTAERTMETAVKALEKINERREKMQAPPNTDESCSVEFKEDRCFVELLSQMLIEIPESEEKAITMLQLQQMVTHLRYKSRQKGSPFMLGQVHTPFLYQQVSHDPSSKSVACATSDSPVNSAVCFVRNSAKCVNNLHKNI